MEVMAVAAKDFPVLPSGLAEVNKMIQDRGDLFSDAHCKVCSAVLISESQKLTHYQSKKHANKVRRFLFIQSDAERPLKQLKSPASIELVQTENLKQEPAGAWTHAAPQAPPPRAPQDGGVSDPDRFCSICQASFNNPLMAQQHYAGKKHRKQTTKRRLMETYGPSSTPASTQHGYLCTVCKLELNSVEQYQSHISGAKHKNQVKKSGLASVETQEAALQLQEGDEFSSGSPAPVLRNRTTLQNLQDTPPGPPELPGPPSRTGLQNLQDPPPEQDLD